MNRVNPIREGDGEMEADEILSLLQKHVTNMYTSIKEAFLAFDQVRPMSSGWNRILILILGSL